MANETGERVRTQRPDNDRASILAEIAELRGGETAEGTKPAAAAAAVKPAVPPANSESLPEPNDDAEDVDVDADAEADDDADEDETDDELDEEKSEAAGDPDTQRRLAIVQRADRRRREAFATERQAFEAERERWRQEQMSLTDKAARHDGLAQRFRADPVGVAVELGIPDDEWDYVAEQLFRMSKKAQEDPRHRETARIARLEREIADQRRREKEAQTKAEESRKAQEAAETAKRHGAEYLSRLAKRATDGVAAKLVKGAPEVAKRQLGQLALELMGDSSELPPVKRVLREYEKRKRAEYAAAGVDVATLLGTPVVAAKDGSEKKPPGAAAVAEVPAAKPENGVPKLRGKDAERLAILAEIRAAREKSRE